MIFAIILSLVIGGFVGYLFGNEAGRQNGFDAARAVYKPTPAVVAKPATAAKTARKVASATKRGRPVGSKTNKAKKTTRKN